MEKLDNTELVNRIDRLITKAQTEWIDDWKSADEALKQATKMVEEHRSGPLKLNRDEQSSFEQRIQQVRKKLDDIPAKDRASSTEDEG